MTLKTAWEKAKRWWEKLTFWKRLPVVAVVGLLIGLLSALIFLSTFALELDALQDVSSVTIGLPLVIAYNIVARSMSSNMFYAVALSSMMYSLFAMLIYSVYYRDFLKKQKKLTLRTTWEWIKFHKVKLIILIVILVIIGYLKDFHMESLREKRDDPQFQCESHDDCVIVQLGCCSCGNCGKATTVNKLYVSDWNKRIGEGCVGVGCAEMISGHWSCYPTTPRCLMNTCILMGFGRTTC